MKVIGHIKSIREERNLRQIVVAMLLDINNFTYTSYEIERDTILITHLIISIDYAMELTNKKQYKDSKPIINRLLLKERLKDLRKQNKLTQIEITKILNTLRST